MKLYQAKYAVDIARRQQEQTQAKRWDRDCLLYTSFPYGFLCIVCAEGFKAGEAFLSGGAS